MSFVYFQATEALLLTEEEDTPTPSPTVNNSVVPPSPGGPIRQSIHPQAVSQRSAPAPSQGGALNFSQPPSAQPGSVVSQAPNVQQQRQVQAASASTPTTPSLPPINKEDAHKWLYKDPQGEIQGVWVGGCVCVCVCRLLVLGWKSRRGLLFGFR